MTHSPSVEYKLICQIFQEHEEEKLKLLDQLLKQEQHSAYLKIPKIRLRGSNTKEIKKYRLEQLENLGLEITEELSKKPNCELRKFVEILKRNMKV